MLRSRELTDRSFLVTGASSGIGEAISRTLIEAGAKVTLAARRVELLDEIISSLSPSSRAHKTHLDVTDWHSCVNAVSETCHEFGGLDGVVVNAGFGAPRGWLESSPEHWREMVLTNVYGAAITIRAALPALIESQGDVLIISSVAGRRVLPGSLYSATKHAVTAMAEAVRLEVAEQGVRVTSIEPGMVDTPFFDDGAPSWSLSADDIARAAHFALTQPAHATLSTITIRPSEQVS